MNKIIEQEFKKLLINKNIYFIPKDTQDDFRFLFYSGAVVILKSINDGRLSNFNSGQFEKLLTNLYNDCLIFFEQYNLKKIMNEKENSIIN